MKNILVYLPVEQRHRQKLEAAAESCNFSYVLPGDLQPQQVAEADIIIGNVPAEYIKQSPRLELLQLNSSGTDEYIRPGVLGPNTVLTNATGAFSKSVAEHTLAMLLMLQKKLHLYRDAQSRGAWIDGGKVVSIADSVITIVGLGEIGMYFARLCKALGAEVIGVKRRAGACPEGIDRLYASEDMDEALKLADVVVSFLPGTGNTAYTYTKERFEIMKPTAIFINCGRGNAVNTQVLIEALEKGLIAAAGIDVMEQEPLPADSPLWKIENLLITPHASGGFHLQETFERIVDIAAENLQAHLNGGKLRNVVDMKTGCKI